MDFLVTTPAVNQNVYRKKTVKFRQVPATMSQKVDPQIRSFQIRHFALQCLRDLHSKQSKKDQIPPTLSNTQNINLLNITF